jgi:DNA-directed RNA polymerase subunit RPC12/RpoP
MVNVCEQCGEAYDSTGYPVCQNCQFDTFIKLRKPDESKDQVNEESQQSNERI